MITFSPSPFVVGLSLLLHCLHLIVKLGSWIVGHNGPCVGVVSNGACVAFVLGSFCREHYDHSCSCSAFSVTGEAHKRKVFHVVNLLTVDVKLCS